jgi:DNA-binding response OmpR family regulator
MSAALRKEVGSAMTSHAPRSNAPSPAVAGSLSTGRVGRIVTVLAISPFDEDHVFLRHLFSHSNWQIHQARSCGEALAVLHDHAIPVVLCECEMPDGSWKDTLADLAELPEAPLLIVTSRLADDNLWAEVLNLGGYDVLMKPFDRLEVLRVISLAWLHWKQQHERATYSEAATTVAVG